MDKIIVDLLQALRDGIELDNNLLNKIIANHNKFKKLNKDHFAKRELLPYFQNEKTCSSELWKSWSVTPVEERKLSRILQMKPRRTSSGVATITVMTKPWGCSSACVYCPNDIRMPKSYLTDEPVCQRAEREYFDPYLQVTSRLKALSQMGHITDKIELIILGGTWSDYPKDYQIWYVTELFRALNEYGITDYREERLQFYKTAGLHSDPLELTEFVCPIQNRINCGELTYNQAFSELYLNSSPWSKVSEMQKPSVTTPSPLVPPLPKRRGIAKGNNATIEQLELQHEINVNSGHRVVGLVIETRPDTITTESLTLIRQLGATKIQIGIQSLNQEVLNINERRITIEKIAEAFELLRIFGFKIHCHFMVNLLGSNPEMDKQDYLTLVTDKRFLPDEVKLYPCCLVEGTVLNKFHKSGEWKPYTEQELIDVLVNDTIATPTYTRISRMIRDISAKDIVAGNKKGNLRQLVEQAIVNHSNTTQSEIPKTTPSPKGATPSSPKGNEQRISEIRYREISSDDIEIDELKLDITKYKTSNTVEYFLQWVTDANKIAGFMRLSLPDTDCNTAPPSVIPASSSVITEPPSVIPAQAGIQTSANCNTAGLGAGEAMIREIHIYGKVATLGQLGDNGQHHGLGKKLIAKASEIASEAGYTKLNVISSVGTRAYYEKQGFHPAGLYQQKPLITKNLFIA
jgi:elongator complex protein 3